MAISGAGEPPRAMLDLVLDQIDGAVSAGLYVAAMMAAITVPDICAALRSPDGETKPDRYETGTTCTWGSTTGLHFLLTRATRAAVQTASPRNPAGASRWADSVVFPCQARTLVMGTSRMNDTLMIGVPTFCAVPEKRRRSG